MKLSNNQKAVLALVIANIIWGAAPPIFKWSLTDIGPYTLAFLRFLIATILIFPFVKDNLSIKPRDFLNIVLMGFFGITINILFFFQGLLYAPSINAAIIASAGPVFIVLFSLSFLKEKPKSKVITGTFIGLLGVLLFLIVPFFKTGAINSSLGNFLMLIATLGAILHTMIGRQVAKRNNPITITFWIFVIGTIGFMPFFANEVAVKGFLPLLSYKAFVGILFGAILSSLVAYLLHNYALKYLTAADVGVFAYIDPIITVLIAVPLLGEYPDVVFLLGSIMVFGGIFIAEGRIHYHPLHRLRR